MFHVYPLGQVGYLFDFSGYRILVDPYLTDSVAEQFGEDLRRRVAPTLPADACTGVSIVMLSHAHLDHTDPESLAAVLKASSGFDVIAPYECLPILKKIGVDEKRIRTANAGDVFRLTEDLTITVVPAAHVQLERDEQGRCRYLGFHIQYGETGIYHAGDTIPHPEIFAALAGRKIRFAFLPVNERNFFRDAAGIVGNMTIREAFAFAEAIQAQTLIPTHWDLFSPNGTFTWEVESLHAALRPAFALRFLPCGARYQLL